MGKNQSASNITNIIKQDANGSISFMHGNTMLMQVSSSGAITTTGTISGSDAANAVSASYALTSTSATTASYADNLLVKGSITAQTLVVQTITSSVDFVTGSTKFGSIGSNTHVFTGSMSVSGSINGYLNGQSLYSSYLGGYGTNQIYTILQPAGNFNGPVIKVRYDTGTANRYIDIGAVDGNGTYSEGLKIYNLSYMTFPGSANIGSSSAPSQRLTISQTNGYPVIDFNNSGAVYGDIGFQVDKMVLSSYSTTPLTMWTSGSEKMRITPNGNVGIGTDNPSFGKLSILGADNTTISSALWGTSTGAGLVASVYNTSQTTDSVAGIRLVTRNSGASVWNIYNISRGNDAGDLAFGNGAGGAGSEKFRITNAGNVLIGTSTLGAGTGVSDLLTIGKSGSTSTGINFTDGTNTRWGFIYINNSKTVYGSFGDVVFESGPSAIEKVRILSNGNVGIGTNSPSSTLDINGSVRYRGSIYNEYEYVASGNFSSGTYYNIIGVNGIPSGVYIIEGYIDTFAAGGGIYFMRFASVPFYMWDVGSNSTTFMDLPPVLGTGHHFGNAFPTFRLQQTLAGAGIYLQFNPNAAWSGMNNASGKSFQVYLKRIS